MKKRKKRGDVDVQVQPLKSARLSSHRPLRSVNSFFPTEGRSSKTPAVSMMLLVAVGFVLILLVVFLIVIIAYTQSSVLMVV